MRQVATGINNSIPPPIGKLKQLVCSVSKNFFPNSLSRTGVMAPVEDGNLMVTDLCSSYNMAPKEPCSTNKQDFHKKGGP